MTDAAAEFCDLCDLPRSQCVHGRPEAPPAPPAARPARAATTRRTPGSPAKPVRTPVARRWTPPEVLAPVILELLREAGGELEADEVFLELEILLEDRLLSGDRETTPEGELRWQYAARRARQVLVRDGLMAKGRPGIWELAAGGRPG